MENEYTCKTCNAPTTILYGSGFFYVYDSRQQNYHHWGPHSQYSA